MPTGEPELPELDTIINAGLASLDSLRLLCLLAYLDIEYLPETLWTRFQSDALRKYFSDDSSIDHLLQPFIQSGFIHRLKAKERPYLCIRNTVLRTTRKFIEGSVDVTPSVG
jgi:hypothetical protein